MNPHEGCARAIIDKSDRMAGTRRTWIRESWLGKLGRRISGDWWRLETIAGKRWGVWHPWRWHRWENYRFTRQEAKKEAWRLNSGRIYGICKECGCTYASHTSGRTGGIECP